MYESTHIAGSILRKPNTSAHAVYHDVIDQIREFESSLPDEMVISISQNGYFVVIEQIVFKESGLVSLKGYYSASKLPARILCHLHQLHLVLLGLKIQNKKEKFRKPIGFVLPNNESV